jgi:hypothetical protein
VITIGALDAVAMPTLRPAAVTSATASTRSCFMTSSLVCRLLRLLQADGPSVAPGLSWVCGASPRSDAGATTVISRQAQNPRT